MSSLIRHRVSSPSEAEYKSPILALTSKIIHMSPSVSTYLIGCLEGGFTHGVYPGFWQGIYLEVTLEILFEGSLSVVGPVKA